MRTLTVIAPGWLVAGLLLLGGLPARAQQVSGSVSGAVQDGQGAVVPNAKVVLVNQAQGAVVREVATSPEGNFVFTPVLPGTYTVTVEVSGFKTYSKADIVLHAADRVGLPPIVLEIGSVGESVTVGVAPLQTVSAERSGVLGGLQVTDLPMVGRSFVDLLKTVSGANGQNINGARDHQNNFTVDGITIIDTAALRNRFSETTQMVNNSSQSRRCSQGDVCRQGSDAGRTADSVR